MTGAAARALGALACTMALGAGGCILPAFSAGTGEGGGADAATTSGASTSTPTSSDASTVGPSSGGGGNGGHAGDGGGGGAGGACVDVLQDPENCGACGVSCLGGACEAGVCQPLLLADTVDVTYDHLALAPDRVYWRSFDLIAFVPTTATETTQPVSYAVAGADMLAADENGAYVTTLDGFVRRLTLQGETVDLADQVRPVGIVVEDGLLYWTENVESASVWSMSTEGGDIQENALGLVFGMQVAVAGGTVYATYQGPTEADGGVVRGDGVPVAGAQRKPSGIAVSANHVYWLDFDGAVWRRGRILIGEPEQVSPPYPEDPAGLDVFNGEVVTDEDHVYWTSPAGTCDGCGAVHRASLGSGAVPEVFADVSASINGLAVDASAVYWTTSSPGGLWRKAKQP